MAPILEAGMAQGTLGDPWAPGDALYYNLCTPDRPPLAAVTGIGSFEGVCLAHTNAILGRAVREVWGVGTGSAAPVWSASAG